MEANCGNKNESNNHIDGLRKLAIKLKLKCPFCGLTWDINNIHKAQTHRNCEWLPLDDFVGKTLDEVIKELNKKHDGIYSFGPSDYHNGNHIIRMNESLWISIVRLSCSDCKKV